MTRQLTRGRAWPAAAAVGLAIGLTAADPTSCDKMPLSAPTESTITLFANSTSVGLSGSVDITATVIESAGTPVQNGTVVTQFSRCSSAFTRLKKSCIQLMHLLINA